MRYLPILLFAIVLLTACAGTPPASNPKTSDQATAQKTAEAKNPGGLRCSSEERTGSLLSSRVCRTEEQILREKEAAQEALRRSTMRTPGQAGGE